MRTSRLASQAGADADVVGGVAAAEQEAEEVGCVSEELAAGGRLAAVEAGVVVGGGRDGDQVPGVG